MGKQPKKPVSSGAKPTTVKNLNHPQSPLNFRLWGAIISFATAFILYANTFNHGWVLDDYGVLADNWVIKSGMKGIPTILTTTYRYGINHLTDNLYRPLSQIMFAIEWEISPENPGFHHIINVLFYALSCGLLFIFLFRLLKNFHPFIPLAITLLYTVHPIHTEVVANIKSRDEIMSFFFILITGLLLIDYFEKNSIRKFLASGITFGLSMFSKEGGITMVVLFPFMGWYFFQSDWKKMGATFVVLLIPSLIYIAIRQKIINEYSTSNVISVVDNILVEAKGPGARIATAIMLLGKYLLLLFIPYQLVCDYSYNQIPLVGLGNPYFLLSFAVHGFLAFIAIREFKKRSLLSFGIIFYFVTMSLYSNLVITIGTSFGERLLFQPSLGFCIAAIAALERIFKIHGSSIQSFMQWIAPNKAFTTILLVVLLLFSAKTVVRAAEWKSQLILFGADVKRSPNSAHMRLYWGLALRDEALRLKDEENNMVEYEKWMRKALKEFEKGIEIYSEYAECMDQAGLAHYRLGNKEKAQYFYEETLKRIPNRATTMSNLGTIYFEKGDYNKALELYEKAVKEDPRYADGWFNLGSTYGMLMQYDKAIEAYEKCIAIDDVYAKAYYYMAMTYEFMNQPEKAKTYYDRAALLDPKLKKK